MASLLNKICPPRSHNVLSNGRLFEEMGLKRLFAAITLVSHFETIAASMAMRVISVRYQLDYCDLQLRLDDALLACDFHVAICIRTCWSQEQMFSSQEEVLMVASYGSKNLSSGLLYVLCLSQCDIFDRFSLFPLL